jgi:nicotinamidase-related amidase
MTDSIQPVPAARTALLVMDYQHGILGRLPNAGAVIEKAKQAIATVRNAGGHVGYVRVAFTDDEMQAVPDRNKGFSALKTMGGDFGVDSPATQIDERIAPQAGDIVVRKSRVGAFSTTDLAQQLQERGIDTLILAGISTSGVILSTVRDAADRDYRLIVLSDACADPQEDVHAFLIDKVLPRQADIIATADLGGVIKA